MKECLCYALAFSVLFAGCAGREANPIPAYLPGDNERSCEVLVAEIAQLQADMQRLLPKTNKGVSNTLWATAGVFLIVPFFFMDLKDAEKIEFEAMRTRHNRLLLICADKSCNMTGVTAERIPSAKEAKEMAKKTKKSKSAETVVTENNHLKICANCEGTIGKLEKSYVFEQQTVCANCYNKLKEQEQKELLSKN